MKLKAGIIGLGVGEAHIQGYGSHPGCEVTALCDLSREKASRAAEMYPGMKITDRADEILEDPEIDVVSIASYDDCHYEQIVKAIDHGKHVFVEKPLCLHEDQAVHIRELLSEKTKLKMSSNLILRKCPRFQLLKKMITSGEMGELFYAEGDYNYGRLHKITEGWRGKLDFYSVVHGGGVHIIDLLMYLTGKRISEVMAYGNNISSRGTQFRYDDMVTCILKFEDGMTGKMSVNFGCVRPHFHGLSIYGKKETFINGDEYGLLYESSDPGIEPRKISEEYPGVHKGDLIRDFVESIVSNTKSEVSKDDVFGAMSVCFAIEEALGKAEPVRVKYI
jgi:predicted dehydrogenase